MHVIRILNNNPGGRIRKNQRSRGSVLLIVLVILSVLVLIATTLSFTSRLEVISSTNFAEGIQARMAAVTGVDTGGALLPLDEPYTAYTQSWALQSGAPGRTRILDRELSNVIISDESAKININAADREFLTRSIAAILRTEGFEETSLAPKIADEIVEYRLGKDNQPGMAKRDDDGDSADADIANDGIDNDGDGIIDNKEEILMSVQYDGRDNNQDGYADFGKDGVEFDGLDNDNDGEIDEYAEGIDEPDEFNPDPTKIPNGDDKPFLTLAELKLLPSMDAGLYEILSPYMTVLSACDPIYSNGGRTLERIDINTASAREIYETLRINYPDRPDAFLKQFAVNIVDARDFDSIPTSLPGNSSDKPVLGLEKVPFINEVWPDSLTDNDEGDDGQYIELYNPWNETIDLSGWKLSVAGASVPLSGQIVPHGFIIVTDDYNESTDPAPEEDIEGYGSFYDIFQIVKGGAARRIIEKREMEIPNESGVIQLVDNRGNIIDWFAWKNGFYDGVRRSFQRDDPRVRLAAWDFCTPMHQNSVYGKTAPSGSDRALFEVRNRLFESPVDLMEVFAGYSEGDSAGRNKSWRGNTWAKTSLSAKSRMELDIGLVDIFTVQDCSRLSARQILKTLGRVDEDDLYRLTRKYNKPPCTYGKININTAPEVLLSAIPGIGNNFAENIENYRRKMERNFIETERTVNFRRDVPFENLSDLVFFGMTSSASRGGFKGLGREDILARLKMAEPYITVHSRTFTIYSENRFYVPMNEKKTESVRHPAKSIIKAHLHITRDGDIRIADWQYLAR